MKPVFTGKNQVTASASGLWETRIDPDFFGGTTYLGTDFTFVNGSENGRLPSGSFTYVLPPGATGFFKVWTNNIPFASVTSTNFRSEASTFATMPAVANVGLVGPVTVSASGSRTNFSGMMQNTASALTYFTIAGYLLDSGSPNI